MDTCTRTSDHDDVTCKPMHTRRALIQRTAAIGLGGAFAALGAPAFLHVSAQDGRTELVAVLEGEPETFFLRDACSSLIEFSFTNIYESLTRRDADGQMVGQLAERFEMVDDTTWRFFLREGVTFHNGEPLNADAVVASVDHYMNPEFSSLCRGDWPMINWPAEKVDEYTVEITTSVPDPLLPTRLQRFRIAAPGWLLSTGDEQLAVEAVGTGPYRLGEWVRGSHVLLQAYEDYWGEPVSIPQIRQLARSDASVRALMVEAGEAQLAFRISPEQMNAVPKVIVEPTTESVGIRLNTESPVLQDARVREALFLSVDAESLMTALYPGYASRLSGQLAREGSVGYNPDLQPYQYDLERAKALVEEAGVVGESLTLVVRAGFFPLSVELGEAIAAMMSQTGLVVTPEITEAEVWREYLFAVEEGQPRSDMLMTLAGNELFDSSRLLDYYGTAFLSHHGDTEVQALIDEARQLSGDERDAAFREIWATVHDDFYMLTLFGLDFIHGAAADLNWEPRGDGFVYYNEMSFGGS